MTSVLFLVLATLTVGAALGTVLARNLVHAALHLVAFFFLVACHFVLLEAEFLAAVQVLVYIGAVAILLVFGIMLTRNVRGDETTIVLLSWTIPAGLVTGGFLVILIAGIRQEIGSNQRPAWSTVLQRPPAGEERPQQATAQMRAIDDMSRTLGNELMSRFAVPFEIAGLLLTAALVGSIALARQETPDDSVSFGGTLSHKNGPRSRRRYHAVIVTAAPPEASTTQSRLS